MSPTLFSDQLFTTVKPYVSPSELKTKIEQALVRSAELDAKRITVDVVGGKVTLKGTVRSWAEKQEAERQAWLAPGSDVCGQPAHDRVLSGKTEGRSSHP
jgi:osmotically-inducible protein OsmY